MNRFCAGGRERSQPEIERFELLSDICLKMNVLDDTFSAMKLAVDSVSEFKGIDAAGIFFLDSTSGDCVLEFSNGLPGWFIDSCSRFAPGSALHEMLKSDSNVFPDSIEQSPFNCEGSPPLFLKGLFPLVLNDAAESIMFIASSEPGALPAEIRGILETLISMLKASISRISAENRSRTSEREHSLLLESIRDPVFALNDNQEVQYCNEAFKQLICFEDESIEKAVFSEVAGNELADTLRGKFDEILDSDGGICSITCEYRKRVFNTFISRKPGGLIVLMSDITESDQTRKELNFREKFESLLINISTDFIEMRGSALNLGINDALLNIGVTIEVDRAYLFQFSKEQKIMNNTHEWCATNIQPQIDKIHELKIDDYPWWMNRLNRHWTIHIPKVTDLPSWAEAERELFESRNIQSLLVVPIVHGNDLIGFLGFDSVNQERYWTEDIIDLLRMLGDAIGNALSRNRMEKQLIEMYRRAEKEAQTNAVLLKEVSHRVKNNLSEIIGLLYAQRRFASNDNTHDEFVQNLISRIRGLSTVHDMLSSSGWKPLELTMLARGIIDNAIVSASCSKKLKASISNSSIRVNPNQAHALALILNELVRNSLKYALADSDSLKIKVRMRKRRAGRITLIYSDNGPGYPVEVLEHNMKNLGLDLIQNLIMKNLQGELTLQNDGGASARISFSRTITEDSSNDSK